MFLLSKKYYFKNCLNSVNEFLNENMTLEKINSLEKEIDQGWEENEDLEVYYRKEYIYIALNCFKKYSKNCILTTYKQLKNNKCKRILDFGAGIGLTTNLLQDLFLDSKVFYYNLEKSLQNEYFLKNKNQKIIILNNKKELENESPFDLIIASELFEHIKKPIEELKYLMGLCSSYFMVQNSFGVKAYGHFKEYEYEGFTFKPKEISKIFTKTINTEFKKIEFNAWNNRPTIFKRYINLKSKNNK